MKKIFTLLLAMGSLTMVFAQSGRHGMNDNNFGQRNTYGTYQNANAYPEHSDYTQRYGGYNDGREQFGQRNDRMMNERMVETRRHFGSQRDYAFFSRPYHNGWSVRNYGHRDFRRHTW